MLVAQKLFICLNILKVSNLDSLLKTIYIIFNVLCKELSHKNEVKSIKVK